MYGINFRCKQSKGLNGKTYFWYLVLRDTITIKMKKRTLKTMVFLCFVLGTSGMLAQNYEPTEQPVKKHTVMEQYEPDMILSVDEREQLKEKHKNLIAKRKSVLDTLDISERRRQRLLRVLSKSPFSNELNKAMADIEFEDETDNQ